MESAECWICRWYFIHVEWRGKSRVVGRYIGWIKEEPHHPCVEDPFNGFKSVDNFLAAGLYYSSEIWGGSYNLLTEWILNLKKDPQYAEPLGCLLAEAIKREWDGDLSQASEVLLVPVPNHPEEKDGYNQALELAKAVHARLRGLYKVRLEEAVEKTAPVKAVRVRAKRDLETRAKKYMKYFRARVRLPPNSLVVIIDDVKTTGTTIEALARTLRSAGAKRIYAAVVARDALRRAFTCTIPNIWENHDYYDDAHPQEAAQLAAYWERLDLGKRKSRILEIAQLVREGRKLVEILANRLNTVNEIDSYVEAERLGIVPVPMDAPEYPSNLLRYGYGDVYPPLVLFRIGKPLNEVLRSPIAVVGTREPTSHGKEAARRIATLLARRGHTVVTGLADGVDMEAAEAAAEAGGAVMGVRPYLLSRSNKLCRAVKTFFKRTEDVTENVAVVAEYLHSVEDDVIMRQRYALRNRIIAGMSYAVIIPEARYKESGWGTKYQVKFGIKARRPVIILKPSEDQADKGVWAAYKFFEEMGAYVADTPEEAVELAEKLAGLQRASR
jgi:DNA processing protein